MSERSMPVIAIDGPAGVGKSTTVRELAKRLGYTLVDTGALYRGIALAAEQRGVPWDDPVRVTALADEVELDFTVESDGTSRLRIDGTDRTEEIRTPRISEGASRVSAYPGVRRALLGIQRRLGKDGGVILEGRDIGTVVFPDAEVKVFLTASPEERAKRRVGDLQARGLDAENDTVLAQIQARDQADSSREVAPLRPADDAIVLDTTQLDFEAVVRRVMELVERWNASRP